MFRYQTMFRLAYPVLDMEEAQNYLSEDNMTDYLHQDLKFTQDAVNLIQWRLKDEQSGVIYLECRRKLSNDESKKISEWITGQNADGLGEGFEQQDFAFYNDSDENDDEDGCWVMASFDWETNSYELELVD